jgi:hypothetical protein
MASISGLLILMRVKAASDPSAVAPAIRPQNAILALSDAARAILQDIAFRFWQSSRKSTRLDVVFLR